MAPLNRNRKCSNDLGMRSTVRCRDGKPPASPKGSIATLSATRLAHTNSASGAYYLLTNEKRRATQGSPFILYLVDITAVAPPGIEPGTF
jgi:hypothetical protein